MPSIRNSAAAPGAEELGSWAFAAVPLEVERARALALAAGPELAFDDPRRGAWYGTGTTLVLERGQLAPFQLADAAERVLAELVPAHGAPEIAPVLLGGFAFDGQRTDAGSWQGFPGGRLVLPELLFHVRGDRAWALLTGPAVAREGLPERLQRRLAELGAPPAASGALQAVEPETSREAWDGAMARALEELERGTVQKVVLARTLRATLSAAPQPAALLPRLRARFPNCVVYLARAGARTFLGATPELLFDREGPQLETMALAGSVRRDPDPARAEALAAQLLQDPKERREHAFVVDAIREALAPLAVELELRGPEVRSLPNIQHLQTSIRAQLAPGTATRTLLERLHPTPAVCGTPRAVATQLLRELEAFPRGWYAGPIGLIGRGHATFAVALRCMLLEGSTARLFAGAGIVPGSDAAREWDETATKSEAMLRVLREVSP